MSTLDSSLYGAARMARAAEASAPLADQTAAQQQTTAALTWNALVSALHDADERSTELVKHVSTALQAHRDAAAATTPPIAAEFNTATDATDESAAVQIRAAQQVDHTVARLVEEALTATARAEAAETQLLSLQHTAVPLAVYQESLATATRLQGEVDVAVASLREAEQIAQRHSAVAFASGAPVSAHATPRSSPALAPPLPPHSSSHVAGAWWIDAVRAAEAEAIRYATRPQQHLSGPTVASSHAHPAAASQDTLVRTQAQLRAAMKDVRALTVENAAMAEQIAHMLSCSSTMGATVRAAQLGRCPAITRSDLRALGMSTLPSFEALSGYSNAAANQSDDALDLSPLCYDDAYALLERMRELIRLTTNEHMAAPSAENGALAAKRTRAEMDGGEAPPQSKSDASAKHVVTRSIAVNTDLVQALEDDLLDRDRHDQHTAASRFALQTKSLAAHEATSDSLALYAAGFDATAQLLERARAHTASHDVQGLIAAVESYSAATIANRATIEKQQRELAQLDEARRVHKATVQALEADLAAAYATAAVGPMLREQFEALQRQMSLLTESISQLKTATVMTQSDSTTAVQAVGEVVKHLSDTTQRLEVQHAVLVEAIQLTGNFSKATTTVTTDDTAANVRGLTETVAQLEAQLASTADALRQERQRAVDALDANWQHELRAQEAIAAYERLKADSEFFVPIGTVASLEAELRDALLAQQVAVAARDEITARNADNVAKLETAESSVRAVQESAQVELQKLNDLIINLRESVRITAAERDAALEKTTRAQHDASVLSGRLAVLERQLAAAKQEKMDADARVEGLKGEFLSGGAVRPEALREVFGSAAEAVEIAVHRIHAIEAELQATRVRLESVEADKVVLESSLRSAAIEAAERRRAALESSVELKDARRVAEREIAQARKQAATATEEASHLKHALRIAEADLAAAVAREEQLKRRVDILVAEPGTTAVRRHGLAQAENLAKQVEELAAREKAALDALEAANQQVASLERQHELAIAARSAAEEKRRVAEEQLTATKATLEQTQASLQSTQQELERTDEARMALVVQLSEVDGTLKEAYTLECRLKEEIQRETARVAALEAELEAKRRDLETSAAELVAQRGRIVELEEQGADAADRATRLTKDNIALHTQALKLEGVIADLQNKLAEARTARATAAVASRGRSSMGGAGALDTSGVRQSVSALVRASSSH